MTCSTKVESSRAATLGYFHGVKYCAKNIEHTTYYYEERTEFNKISILHISKVDEDCNGNPAQGNKHAST